VASQAGSAAYTAAASVTQSFTVSAGSSFTLSLAAPSLTLTRGTGGSVIVTAKPVGSFSGTVTFSETGVPTNVNNGFLGTGGTNQAYFIVYPPAGVAAGTYTVTIKGTSGSASATATLTLILN
jgi:hypothetical protein